MGKNPEDGGRSFQEEEEEQGRGRFPWNLEARPAEDGSRVRMRCSKSGVKGELGLNSGSCPSPGEERGRRLAGTSPYHTSPASKPPELKRFEIPVVLRRYHTPSLLEEGAPPPLRSLSLGAQVDAVRQYKEFQ